MGISIIVLMLDTDHTEIVIEHYQKGGTEETCIYATVRIRREKKGTVTVLMGAQCRASNTEKSKTDDRARYLEIKRYSPKLRAKIIEN